MVEHLQLSIFRIWYYHLSCLKKMIQSTICLWWLPTDSTWWYHQWATSQNSSNCPHLYPSPIWWSDLLSVTHLSSNHYEIFSIPQSQYHPQYPHRAHPKWSLPMWTQHRNAVFRCTDCVTYLGKCLWIFCGYIGCLICLIVCGLFVTLCTGWFSYWASDFPNIVKATNKVQIDHDSEGTLNWSNLYKKISLWDLAS